MVSLGAIVFKKLGQVNKDVWLLILIVLPAFGLMMCGRFSESNQHSSEDCYGEAAADIIRREGNRRINRSDVARYEAELTNRCR